MLYNHAGSRLRVGANVLYKLAHGGALTAITHPGCHRFKIVSIESVEYVEKARAGKIEGAGVCFSCGRARDSSFFPNITRRGRKPSRLCSDCMLSTRVRGQKWRATRAGLTEHFTEEEWKACVARYNGRCAHCGAATTLCADHIIPMGSDSSNAIENIQPLCRGCNTSKSARMTVAQILGKDQRDRLRKYCEKHFVSESRAIEIAVDLFLNNSDLA